jgi:hypothetical protein
LKSERAPVKWLSIECSILSPMLISTQFPFRRKVEQENYKLVNERENFGAVLFLQVPFSK